MLIHARACDSQPDSKEGVVELTHSSGMSNMSSDESILAAGEGQLGRTKMIRATIRLFNTSCSEELEKSGRNGVE